MSSSGCWSPAPPPVSAPPSSPPSAPAATRCSPPTASARRRHRPRPRRHLRRRLGGGRRRPCASAGAGSTSWSTTPASRAAAAIERCSLEEWQWIIDINLFGVVRGTRAFAPMLKEQGSGRLVNVASLAGLVHPGGMGSYNAVKAAVVAFTETCGHELAPYGVRRSVVCPSYFRTNLMDSMRGSDEARRPGDRRAGRAVPDHRRRHRRRRAGGHRRRRRRDRPRRGRAAAYALKWADRPGVRRADARPGGASSRSRMRPPSPARARSARRTRSTWRGRGVAARPCRHTRRARRRHRRSGSSPAARRTSPTCCATPPAAT